MTDPVRRPAFRFTANDSLQYHFFADNRLFSIRMAYRGGHWTHAAWIYDGSAREIAKSPNLWVQSDSPYLDIQSDIAEVRDEDGEIVVIVHATSSEDSFEARVRPLNTLTWMDTLSESNEEVLHLPDLTGTLKFRGKTYDTKGYCKHVMWHTGPRYTGYRFLHGFVDDGELAIWSADAVFAYQKYDYFKMAKPDGTIIAADYEQSSHKQNTVYARIGERAIKVDFEELGMWELPIVNSSSDMVIMQRYGNIRYTEGSVVKTGFALTEYGFGKYSDNKL